jgi:hypothetical protein
MTALQAHGPAPPPAVAGSRALDSGPSFNDLWNNRFKRIGEPTFNERWEDRVPRDLLEHAKRSGLMGNAEPDADREYDAAAGQKLADNS